ncbi:MAG TPA: MBL fold metallo-hydrolase [Candidatus Choladousia intestinipullorum]|nr:MBL fold metallo-hydrolase [Candidatus Choladousia intestinipullorum]
MPAVSGNTEVHFLDVGEGLSILVKSDGHAMLYDGGDRNTSSFVVSYLRRQGIETLDYVIASHYDADHLSGLIGALYAFDVGQVLGPDYVHDSDTYQSFLTAVNAQGLTVTHPSVGDVYQLGNASFTVLAPVQAAAEPNNNSIVIRLVNGSTSFLFPGDAEQASENEMCRSGYLLKSDVLCPGHHGSASSTGYEFLMRVRPEYAVISAGAGNEYGHPHRETLDLLAAAGVTVYRTDQSGTVVMYSDGSRIVPSPELSVPQQS